MESTKKRPHQALSLEKKLRILQDLDRSGLSKTEVAKKFNIPKSTLSRILKNKEAIEGAFKNGTFTSKRMRMTPDEDDEGGDIASAVVPSDSAAKEAVELL
ncbi:hypothetical protein HPB50_025999 [Hyalomma asiaticum]|uniref:Uncharacterized protein n=1 Tax=Hyalomma asiaticum TaxID=266040 RepID=A0ACB7STG5_HYAAI|nr:hypothetical protein HPB50_025999 [Hyalomma asiaticum]